MTPWRTLPHDGMNQSIERADQKKPVAVPLTTLRFDVENSALGVRQTMTSLMTSLRKAGVSPEACTRVEIALTEALNNVVEHAVAGKASGRITLAARGHRGQLVVCLRDNGAAFPNLRLPSGHAANLDVERAHLPEGGFGWYLIRNLVKALRYTRRNGMNYLTMLLALD